MNRIIAMIVLSILVIGSTCAFAESGMSSDTPSGGMGNPPEGMSFPEGMTPPDGMSFPEGMDFSNFSGGFPGGRGEKAEGVIGSFTSGGSEDYAYDAALYVTADGIDEEKSATDRILGGYDATSAEGIVIEDSQSGDNGVIIVNTDYTISNATIDLLTDADGTDTCDFSGKGTAIAVYGSDANVTIEDSAIHTSGVATMPVFADDGATVTIKNSTLRSDGGTLSANYLNTPDQGTMVAPPWILGIMGTSRTTNMMGDGTTTNVIDSETSAGAWAVLSTDNGSNMALNVYNSTLTLNNTDESAAALIQTEDGQISETLDNPYTVNYGTGYGTFVIGGAEETFAGATLNVGTYAAILGGGSATYTALKAGQSYELKNVAGETTATYEATEDKATEIHSDTFGFMAYQNENIVTLEKGTVMESGDATFLIKSGSSGETTTATVDDATITNGGVLIQVMDSDDATNGGMMAADDARNTNGGMMNFKPNHTENADFNTEAATAGSTEQSFSFTNGSYTGNIYNASGSEGLEGTTLNVTFGTGAEYSGAIASTAAIHVTYDGAQVIKANGGYAFDDADEAAYFAGQYQNTDYSIIEYWSMGHVANLVNDNDANAVSVALTGDAVWTVNGTSLITSLSVKDDAQVVIPKGIVLIVGNTEYTDCVLTAKDM